jgi:hypothetical protein
MHFGLNPDHIPCHLIPVTGVTLNLRSPTPLKDEMPDIQAIPESATFPAINGKTFRFNVFLVRVDARITVVIEMIIKASHDGLAPLRNLDLPSHIC